MRGRKADVPEPFGSIVDRVNEQDREWFAERPFADERFRKYVDGEFWPMRYREGSRVKVRLLAPGIRSRQIIGPEIEPFDADEAAVAREHMADAPPGLVEEQ